MAHLMPAGFGGSSYDRVRAWYAATTLLRAADAVACGSSAWVARTPQWPASYAHNALVLSADPGAAQVVSWADAGLTGLDHRTVLAFCRMAAGTVEGLVAAGYDVQSQVLMARTPELFGTTRARAYQVDPYGAEVRELQERLWREEWLPGAPDDTVEQLVDRRSELERAGDAVTLVAREDGLTVACLDVTVREGITELDGLATLTAYRGRGYGEALMAAGCAYAHEVGAELVTLAALVEDWPRTWYVRLGFTELGPATEATRVPARIVANSAS